MCRRSRIDIAADALAELASDEYDGKTIVFTVRGNFSSAKISATLKYAAPEPIAKTADGLVKVMAFTDGGQTATFTDGHDWTLTGEGFSDDEANPHKWTEARIELNPESGEGAAVTHTIAADGKSATVRRVSTASVDPGTYPNARLIIEVASETLGSETLVLPMKYVVPEA